MMSEKQIKSATVTYYNEYNYGAVLQAFALQHYLKNNGFENHIVHYSARKEGLFDKLPKKLDRQWLYFCKRNIIAGLNYKKIKQKQTQFNQFIDSHLELTGRYNSMEQLEANPPEVELLITGSDQVWNISGTFRKDFFLMFGGRSMKRASYAASMGRCDFNDDKGRMLWDAVTALDAVSVREREAAAYLQKGGITAEVVADPTFLVDADTWSALASPPQINEKYILCYPLLYHEDMDRVLQELKRQTGYRVVTLKPSPESRCYGDTFVLDAGPAEFLSLIQNAEYVVTSSFHGTVFSILFQKEFYTLNNTKTNGRIAELLEKTQLQNRFNPSEVTLQNPIDYPCVHAHLKADIQRSEMFIAKIREMFI